MGDIVHDFSIASMDELEAIAIKKVDEEEQWTFFDWFDDTFSEKLDIKENLNDLKHYHEEMMDTYNIGKKKLKSIIKDVTFVDDTHAKIWEQIDTELSLYLNKINVLIDTIKPSTLAYKSSEDLKTYLDKVDERYTKAFESSEANIELLHAYIEQELYPPEWWESTLSGVEGFVVSVGRNLIFDPLYGVAKEIGFEDFARNGVQGLDNFEKWLRENTFNENTYLTGSKLGEITSIVVGIYEMIQGASMIVSGIAGEIGGGLLALTGVGVAPGGAVMASSGELIFAGAGVFTMGVATTGSGLGKVKEPIEKTEVDLEDIKEVDPTLDVGEGASGGKKTVDINNPVLDNIRTGSALKTDAQHAFNDIIDNYAGDATKFTLEGGDGINR